MRHVVVYYLILKNQLIIKANKTTIKLKRKTELCFYMTFLSLG